MKFRCPKCNRRQFSILDIVDNGRTKQRAYCDNCGYWTVTDLHCSFSNCFTLVFETRNGDKGEFIGTKEEIHRQIDDYLWTGFNNCSKQERLRLIARTIEILKNGYNDEFTDDYREYEIMVDNFLYMKISYGI